jgi:hypothetical protein
MLKHYNDDETKTMAKTPEEAEKCQTTIKTLTHKKHQ